MRRGSVRCERGSQRTAAPTRRQWASGPGVGAWRWSGAPGHRRDHRTRPACDHRPTRESAPLRRRARSRVARPRRRRRARPVRSGHDPSIRAWPQGPACAHACPSPSPSCSPSLRARRRLRCSDSRSSASTPRPRARPTAGSRAPTRSSRRCCRPRTRARRPTTSTRAATARRPRSARSPTPASTGSASRARRGRSAGRAGLTVAVFEGEGLDAGEHDRRSTRTAPARDRTPRSSSTTDRHGRRQGRPPARRPRERRHRPDVVTWPADRAATRCSSLLAADVGDAGRDRRRSRRSRAG